MDDLIIKMIMNYGKHTDKYWFNNSGVQVQNIQLKGDTIFYEVYDGHYTEREEIELLELLAWVHSNVA